MRQGALGGRTRAAGAAAFGAALLSAVAAAAQSPDAPTTGRLTFSTAVDLNTNRSLAPVSPGTSLSVSESLGFSYRTETGTQLFELSGSGGLALDRVGGGAVSGSLATPQLRLRYTREAASGKLAVDARHDSRDVTSSFLADPLDPSSLIADSGTLATTSASVTANMRQDAPLSFSFDASYSGRDYSGTTDPALFDETTFVFSSTANLRLSPTTRAGLSLSQTSYVSADPFSTRYLQTDIGVVLSHDLADGTVLRGDLGYRDRRTTASSATTLETGLIGGIDISRPLPDGAVFGSLRIDSSSAAGTTTVLTFGRQLELPDGTLAASVSADYSPTGGVRLVGSASYSRQLSDGSVSLDVNQSLTTDNFGQDLRLTNLGFSYQKSLSPVDGISLSLNLGRSEDAGTGTAPTQDRAAFSATYTRMLAPDWSLSAGYRRQQLGGASVATSDSLFLTLTKDLQFAF